MSGATGALWYHLRTHVDLQRGYYGVVSIADLPLFRSCLGGLQEESRRASLPLIVKGPTSGNGSAVGSPKDPFVYS